MTPEEFEKVHREAGLRLSHALEPTTPEEIRVVAWLTGWEAETMNAITTMILRRSLH